MPPIDYAKWDDVIDSDDEDHYPLGGSAFTVKAKADVFGMTPQQVSEAAGKTLHKMWGKAKWWHDLPNSTARMEWIVNCYQLRLDDDCAQGVAKGRRGLYAIAAEHSRCSPKTAGREMARDFFVFINMAKENGVLPIEDAGFRWTALFQAAKKRLVLFFEKRDAEARWGADHVEKLQTTADFVYGFSADTPRGAPHRDKNEQKMRELGMSFNSIDDPKERTKTFRAVAGWESWSDVATNCMFAFAECMEKNKKQVAAASSSIPSSETRKRVLTVSPLLTTISEETTKWSSSTGNIDFSSPNLCGERTRTNTSDKDSCTTNTSDKHTNLHIYSSSPSTKQKTSEATSSYQ